MVVAVLAVGRMASGILVHSVLVAVQCFFLQPFSYLVFLLLGILFLIVSVMVLMLMVHNC